MDWLALVYDIFRVAIIPAIGVLTVYFAKWLKAKELEIIDRVDNDTADKYIAMLFETVRDCVTATTQTYVESLKSQGKFDLEAQKEAFRKTYDAVLAQLTEEAKVYLSTIYGDLNALITTKIEAEVNAQK